MMLRPIPIQWTVEVGRCSACMDECAGVVGRGADGSVLRLCLSCVAKASGVVYTHCCNNIRGIPLATEADVIRVLTKGD